MSRAKDNSPNNSSGNNYTNYFRPLQTVEDANSTSTIDDEPESGVAVKMPVIPVIKQTSKFVHDLLAKNVISEYFIKTITIGHKIYLKSEDDFKATLIKLR